MNNIALFCGSKLGLNQSFKQETAALGKILGNHKKHVIYGGSTNGLMGVAADAVIEHGGTVTGIIPEFLHSIETKHQGITELIVTNTMHERKKILFEKADAAIILPGGFGTMDELFELVTWNQLSIHQIKVFILNVDGFYNNLQQQIQKMNDENFLYLNPYNEIIYLNNGSAIASYL